MDLFSSILRWQTEGWSTSDFRRGDSPAQSSLQEYDAGLALEAGARCLYRLAEALASVPVGIVATLPPGAAAAACATGVPAAADVMPSAFRTSASTLA